MIAPTVESRSSSILECKCIQNYTHYSTTLVEVAPYWNVNETKLGKYKVCGLVEVAPYWNVNHYHIAMRFDNPRVEVAPYWNVNSKTISSPSCCFK